MRGWRACRARAAAQQAGLRPSAAGHEQAGGAALPIARERRAPRSVSSLSVGRAGGAARPAVLSVEQGGGALGAGGGRREHAVCAVKGLVVGAPIAHKLCRRWVNGSLVGEQGAGGASRAAAAAAGARLTAVHLGAARGWEHRGLAEARSLRPERSHRHALHRGPPGAGIVGRQRRGQRAQQQRPQTPDLHCVGVTQLRLSLLAPTWLSRPKTFK